MHADNALCDRFLAFVAQVSGDATGEFKRRISFLLETGKIGEEHLARMFASNAPISPFGAGEHVAAGVVPHQAPIDRLVASEALDWKDVKRFLEDLRAGVKRSSEESKTHEKATETFLYPDVRGRVKGQLDYPLAPAAFEKAGMVYLVFVSGGRYLLVIEARTGKEVSRVDIGLGHGHTSPVVFEEDGKTYVAVGDYSDRLYVIEALTGKKVAEPKMGSQPHGKLQVFEQGGETYIVVESENSEAKVVRAITGATIARVGINGARRVDPALFKRDGRTYVVVGSGAEKGKTAICVFDALTGEVVHSIEIGGSVESGVVVFRDGETFYAAALASDMLVYVVDLGLGKIVNKFEPSNWRNAFLSGFEQNGHGYVVAMSLDVRSFDVREALTGERVREINLGSDIEVYPELFDCSPMYILITARPLSVSHTQAIPSVVAIAT